MKEEEYMIQSSPSQPLPEEKPKQQPQIPKINVS